MDKPTGTLPTDYISYVRGLVGHAPLIMVGAGVAVFDPNNRLLLQRRADTREWALSGGFMELGESLKDTARREVLEETGLTLANLQLFTVFSKPVKTLRNGDQVQVVHVIYTSRNPQGNLQPQAGEVLELRYFDLGNLPEDIFEPHRAVLNELRERFTRRDD